MRSLAALAIVPLLALAGCSATPSAPMTRAVHGVLVLATGAYTDAGLDDNGNLPPTGSDCSAADGYADIASGTEVDVVDAAGKVLAVSALGSGATDADYHCSFRFTVADVPTGGKVYGLKVGNQARGIVHFSKAGLFARPQLTLG